MQLSQIEYTADGFPGQRMRVVPRPVVAQAMTKPPLSELLVTDCGYFPHAARHRKKRRHGLSVLVLIACVSGSGTAELDGVKHTIHAGEVMLIHPGVAHLYQADEDNPWTIWWLHVAGSALEPLLREARLDKAHPIIAVSDVHRIASLIEEVISRIERDETATTLLTASGAAWHLLSLLASDRVPLGSREDPVLRAQNYLRSRIGYRTSVPELASFVGLSPSHFSAVFRAKTGTGVIEYQTRLRMGVARELLDMTDQTIEQIARAVGYPDAFYFSRQFRQIHDVSPRGYRSRTRNQAADLRSD
jgi:AraC-like DNA-binding protein